jgi:hypothetical protein
VVATDQAVDVDDGAEPFVPIRGAYRLTIGDRLRLVPPAARSRGGYLFGGAMLLLGGVQAPIGDIALGIFSAAFGLSVVTGWFSIPFSWWAMRGRRDVYEGRYEIVVTQDEVRNTCESADSTVKWTAFRPGGRELRTAFLLRHAAGVSQLLPKAAFSDGDIGRLRQVLRDRRLIP